MNTTGGLLWRSGNGVALAGGVLALTLMLAPAPLLAQSMTPPDETADADADEETTAAEPIVISQDEARACAARLEPMAASFENPEKTIYLRRLGETAFQLWAPREPGPSAPFRPWCITTLEAIAETSFVNATDRALVMQLVAQASPDPPPVRAGAGPTEPPPPPPTVVMEEEEEEPRGLPAAYQRTPPMGGRSAPRVGVPVPASAGLPEMVRATVAACRTGGGQPTAVFDRLSSRLLTAECRMPDGTATALPALAADLGADDSGR